MTTMDFDRTRMATAALGRLGAEAHAASPREGIDLCETDDGGAFLSVVLRDDGAALAVVPVDGHASQLRFGVVFNDECGNVRRYPPLTEKEAALCMSWWLSVYPVGRPVQTFGPN